MTVLSWFKSYLSSRSFRVKCDNNLSSFHTFSCGVPRALFSAVYFSSCILPLSTVLWSKMLWSLPFSSTTAFMQMTLSSSSLSTHSTLTHAFLTLKTLFSRSLPGWLLIFLLLTPLRLNSCSSDSKTNLPKYTTLHSTPPTLLEIFASFLTNIPSLTKLYLSPKPVMITFVKCLYQCYLHRPLQNWLL